MDIQIRFATEADREPAFALRVQAFSADRPEYRSDEEYLPDDRRLVAVDGDRVVGHLAMWELGQFYGGRRVPMGGVAGVVVPPDMRRRGVASALLRRSLEVMRERGEALSTLYPATLRPYRRSGWELAGAWIRRVVQARDLHHLPEPTRTTLRTGGPDDLEAMQAVYERTAPAHNGMLDHPMPFLRRQLGDDEYYRYVALRDGDAVGYLVYSHVDAVHDRASYHLRVKELVGVDLDAELALWHALASSSSMAEEVQFTSRPADPLLLLLPENALQAPPYDWVWMTRLVDAPAAVAARGYLDGVRAQVELDVVDEVAPWNAGPHVLEVEGGEGRLTPGGDGHVRCETGTLASLYTGWTSPFDLHRYGRLEGASDADLAALSRAFNGPMPWMRNYF